MHFLGFLLIGFVAGLLARFFVPGRQPMGCVVTTVIGMVGSFVGGLLVDLIWGAPAAGIVLHPTGLIGSTIGAILVLLVFGYTQRRPPM